MIKVLLWKMVNELVTAEEMVRILDGWKFQAFVDNEEESERWGF
jgi:hypothetical protein